MNINGVLFTDQAIDMLRSMQEENNSTLESFLDSIDEIEDLVIDPNADPDPTTRLCLIQNLRGVKKLIEELKIHPDYVYE